MVQEQVALCRAPTLGMGVGMRGWTFRGGPIPLLPFPSPPPAPPQGLALGLPEGAQPACEQAVGGWGRCGHT